MKKITMIVVTTNFFSLNLLEIFKRTSTLTFDWIVILLRAMNVVNALFGLGDFFVGFFTVFFFSSIHFFC